MLKALNTAATGMQAQQSAIDVTANNLANVGTTGFKKSRAEFEDLLYETTKDPGSQNSQGTVSPNGVQTGLGVKTAAVSKNFEDGAPRLTKAPLDLMVEGQGFFPVQTPNGQVAYTRDGSFKKDATGRIVDKNGNTIIPEITIPPNAAGINIADNGEVSYTTTANSQAQPIGQMQLVNFINPSGLKAIGKNLFVPTNASGNPQQGVPGEGNLGTISQGQLEASNVNLVDEMVNMINHQRSFETNSKMVQAADQMMQSINNLR